MIMTFTGTRRPAPDRVRPTVGRPFLPLGPPWPALGPLVFRGLRAGLPLTGGWTCGVICGARASASMPGPACGSATVRSDEVAAGNAAVAPADRDALAAVRPRPVPPARVARLRPLARRC